MNFIQKYFVEVKHGTKVTYSESDLRKLDRTYEKEVIHNEARKVRSPAKKAMQHAYLTQLRDYAYEKILDDHIYTFSHLLVIPNPYDLVKQSALLLFNSSKETKIRYRVKGDIPAADFVGETDFTTRHRVPIMGLYLARNNQLELEMIDHDGEVVKRRSLQIYVSESPQKIKDVFGKMEGMEHAASSRFPFLLVNGVAFNPLVVDCEGKIRYSIQLRTSNIGMIPLQDGHFLYEDRTVNRMGKNGRVRPCRYHEMDYLGRVYQTYLLDYPLTGAVAQGKNSLFMVTSSDADHMRDSIIEVDRKSGEIQKKCDLMQIFGDGYRKRPDWAHISSIFYSGGRLLVTLRRLHTVFEYDWEKGELIWILAPEVVWKNQPVAAYVLKGDQPNEEVCWKPEFSAYHQRHTEGKESKCLTVFSIRSNAGLEIRKKQDKVSSFAYLKIDEEKRTFQTLLDKSWVKNRSHGSGFFSESEEGLLLCSGISRKTVEGNRGQITEFDLLEGKELRTLYAKKGINTIWEFAPNIPAYAKVVPLSKQVVYGRIDPPEKFTGELPEISEEKLPREVFGGVTLCEELYICRILPGTISRIYFIGERYAYVQDYSGMAEKKVRFPFAVSLHEFQKDTYYVYVEFEGMVHRLKNEIRIIE